MQLLRHMALWCMCVYAYVCVLPGKAMQTDTTLACHGARKTMKLPNDAKSTLGGDRTHDLGFIRPTL